MTTAIRDVPRTAAPVLPRRERALAELGTGLVAAVAGLGLGAVLAAALETLLPLELSAVWLATAVGRLAAVSGTYLMLWMILLVARVAPIERAIGQDRLVRVHKTVGPWSIWLIVVHVVASVLAWSLGDGASWWAELWSMTVSQPWILPADAAVLALVAAGVTSWRRARRRLRREVWWTVHLYTYLAVALAFAHQITIDGPFLTGWGKTLWIGLYVGLAALVVGYRIVLPLRRSLAHDLKVVRVVRESHDVVSVWIGGRDLEGLGIRPGQFANWRFLAPGLVYEAHPYSFSAPVTNGIARISVKDLGDASRLTARLRRGTRVLIEGPYGVMTAERVATTGRVVLVAGGIGVGPVRALAEDLAARGVRLDIIVRASSAADLALHRELESIGSLPHARLHTLVGHRDVHPMDARELHALVPDLAACDLYVCGPAGLIATVADAAAELGLPERRVHVEDFEM